MKNDFINLTEENVSDEHLCCIIRSRKPHSGISAKREWLSDRLKEGHVFRKLNVKGTVFIEYAPLETAWVPIEGSRYYYIYCLWATGEYKGKGYGKQLLEYCIADAKANGKSGICVLGAKKQKAWLTDQSFLKRYGFQVVDTTESGYELLALSFDGTFPQLCEAAKKERITNQDLTVFYDMQCPYILKNVDIVRQYCEKHDIPVAFHLVDTLEKAKAVPCVFNNWAVFYKGSFQTVKLLLDIAALKRIVKK